MPGSRGPPRWRWLWLAHPAVTLFAVVATANHYWLDAIVASTMLAATLVVLRPPAVVTAPSDEPEAGVRCGDDRTDHPTAVSRGRRR